LREIKTVEIVSMSHLDVGYTGSMAFTLNTHFSEFFPRAIAVQKNLTAAKRPEKLHYITHPWAVYMYMHCNELGALHMDAPLKCPNASAKAEFVDAVKEGVIVWHAGPMNMQAEGMNAALFQFGVNLSHSLDDAFGLPHKTTLSLRDVPGLTIGTVPLLQEVNVSGLTVGANGGFCAPWLPYPLFRWETEDPFGKKVSVVATWHPGGYPDMYECKHGNMLFCDEQTPGTVARRDCLISGDRALCFAFRTDNTGPPESEQEVIRGFAVAQTQFPTAAVVAGSLDSFFQHAQSDHTLPVVREEVGDCWIQGIQTDVKKASFTRRIQTAWAPYARVEPRDQVVDKAATLLLKLGEHTWGLGGLLNASTDWTNAMLQQQLANGSFAANIRTYDEQRAFAYDAAAMLPNGHPLRKEWEGILNKQTAAPDLSGFVLTPERRFDSPRGAVDVTGAGELLLRQDGLRVGQLSYETNSEDIYNVSNPRLACSAALGGKSGSARYGGATRYEIGRMVALYTKRSTDVANTTMMEGTDRESIEGAAYVGPSVTDGTVSSGSVREC
jgi:hypothetical protein